MPLPSFSIIVPTYQRKPLVTALMDTLRTIDYEGRWDVIVVVDGSTDGTAAALRTLHCPFPLTIVEQPNCGLAAAKDRGASAARGDVLLFLDDDMSFRSDILDQYAAVFASCAGAASGDITLKPSSVAGFAAEEMAEWLARRSRVLRAAGALSPFEVCGGNLAVKREFYEQVGGFDPRYTSGGGYGCDDVDLAIRLTEAGCDIKACPGALVEQVYDIGPRQIIGRTSRRAAAELRFVRRHPAFAGEIRAMRRADAWRTRFLIVPLARLGVAGGVAAGLAIWLAQNRDSLPPWAAKLVPTFFWRIDNLVYWSAMRRLGGFPASDDVLALCYHAVADLADDPVMSEYGIARDEFERQIDNLLARGFTFVSPAELNALLVGEAHVPRRAVLLTFDDCYAELADVTREVLVPREVPALAFAVAGNVGGTNEWDQPNGASCLELLDQFGLRELARAGVEIGCHSFSHTSLPDVAPERLAIETAGAADELEAICAARPRFFAYPHGAVDSASRAAVRSAHYEAAFGIERGKITRSSDRFALPRLCIVAAHKGWRFRLATGWPNLGVWLEDTLLRVRIQRELLPRRLLSLANRFRPT
jgi:GT2 family glycosyltransferase/peptidoglycan/xylan/chitin deacetylase (PgdA/CDA1 family)